jgi:hypothetical protein
MKLRLLTFLVLLFAVPSMAQDTIFRRTSAAAPSTTQVLMGRGNATVTNPADIDYSYLSGGATGGETYKITDTETLKGTLLPPGTLNNFRAQVDCDFWDDIGGAGDNVVFTILEDGVATGLTCTVTGEDPTQQNTPDVEELCPGLPINSPVTVDGTERYSLSIESQGTVSDTCLPAWSVEFTPTVSNRTVMTSQANQQSNGGTVFYLPPGAGAYSAVQTTRATAQADAMLTIPIAGNITGIMCRSSAVTSSQLTRLWVNSSVQSSFDCTNSSAGTTVTVTPTPLAVAAGDTVSIGYDTDNTAGMVWSTLFFEPTDTGKWWTGFTLGPPRDWLAADTFFHSPLSGYQNASALWNHGHSFSVPANVNFEMITADISVATGVGESLDPTLVYHVEDPATSNSRVTTSLACLFNDGSTVSCTSTAGAPISANGTDMYQMYFSPSDNPATSTLRHSTVYSKD